MFSMFTAVVGIIKGVASLLIEVRVPLERVQLESGESGKLPTKVKKRA